MQNARDERLAQWTTDADRSIKSRAWNEKKITAHHAIIPTTVACNMNSLSREERNIYFLISQAYIAQFYGEHVYEQTKIVVEQCKDCLLYTSGYGNGKQFLYRLNHYGITRDAFEEAVNS